MIEDEMIAHIATLQQETKSLQYQINELKKDREILRELVSSVKLLAYKTNEVQGQLEAIDKKVTSIEREPADRWKSLVAYIVAALVSGGIGSILTRFIERG